MAGPWKIVATRLLIYSLLEFVVHLVRT
jgi:hypothetical protein